MMFCWEVIGGKKGHREERRRREGGGSVLVEEGRSIFRSSRIEWDKRLGRWWWWSE